MQAGTLFFFCGKMGAGKSTQAGSLARKSNAVLLSEDEWLASLYPGQILTLPDYVKCSGLLKPQMKALVQSILATGTSVVMDFPANTIAQRDWFRGVFDEVGAPHQMLYLDVPDEVCLQRIALRRQEQPQRAKTDTPEMFEAMAQYFTPPTQKEGFNVTTVLGAPQGGR